MQTLNFQDLGLIYEIKVYQMESFFTCNPQSRMAHSYRGYLSRVDHCTISEKNSILLACLLIS